MPGPGLGLGRMPPAGTMTGAGTVTEILAGAGLAFGPGQAEVSGRRRLTEAAPPRPAVGRCLQT